MQIDIIQLVRDPLTDGVVTVHWRASQMRGGLEVSTYGVRYLQPEPSSEGFVPFQDLTEQAVVGWLYSDKAWRDGVLRILEDREARLERPTLAGLPTAWQTETAT